jgi:20S proteasome alpha/beta subunit
MTLIIGIAAKDRIIVAADGKVFDTEKGILNKPKIFQLSNNCIAMMAGQQINDLEAFIQTLQKNVTNQQLQDVEEIANYITDFAGKRTWAEHADVKKSHMTMLIAGYKQNKAHVYVLLSTGKLEAIGLQRYALGNWDRAIDHLYSALERKDPSKISPRTAEKIAVEMLAEGEKANSKDIGGQGMLWHVLPHKVERKSTSYLSRLQQKYLK